VGGIWKSLVDFFTRECCMQSLMGDSGGRREDQNADRNVDIKDYAHELSDGDKDSIGNWTKTGHLCDNLAKDLPVVCLHLEILCEVEFNDDGLINMVEEISRQTTLAVAWLLLNTFS
jgi:hypothetical protein